MAKFRLRDRKEDEGEIVEWFLEQDESGVVLCFSIKDGTSWSALTVRSDKGTVYLHSSLPSGFGFALDSSNRLRIDNLI